MNKFGVRSDAELLGADPLLRRIAYKVLKIKDHSVLKSHRPEHEQNEAFESGNSKLQWPDGKHNAWLSKALDVQTYPRPPTVFAGYEDDSELRAEQYYLLGLYVGIAAELGIKLRSGADWDSDGEVSDNGWDDLFHVELVD